MKQERKEELLRSFPAVPEKYNLIMLQNKYAENFSIFLTNGRELFVRCFHKYSGKKVVIERQRYVFAKDGAVRYGIKYDDNGKIYWAALTKFREPVFASSYYGKGFNNDYSILNREAIEQSDMKYSCLSPSCNFPMEYLRLYCQHPNLEYLIKAGYESLISEEYYGFWGSNTKIYIYSGINWKSNNLLRTSDSSSGRTWSKLRGCRWFDETDRLQNFQDNKISDRTENWIVYVSGLS